MSSDLPMSLVECMVHFCGTAKQCRVDEELLAQMACLVSETETENSPRGKWIPRFLRAIADGRPDSYDSLDSL